VRLSAAHEGSDPPPLETCARDPDPGNDWTTTSRVPVTAESYASHRSSGETSGALPTPSERHEDASSSAAGFQQLDLVAGKQIEIW